MSWVLNGSWIYENLLIYSWKYFLNQLIDCNRCSLKTDFMLCEKLTSLETTNYSNNGNLCHHLYKFFLLHSCNLFLKDKNLLLSKCICCFPAEGDSTHLTFQIYYTNMLVLFKKKKISFYEVAYSYFSSSRTIYFFCRNSNVWDNTLPWESHLKGH